MKGIIQRVPVFVFCVLVFMAEMITAHAYAILSLGGFSPYPTEVVSAKGFSSDVNSAISRSCQAWNNAGAGTLVTRASYTHSNNSFPRENDENQVTAISEGTKTGFMTTEFTQYKVIGLKCYNTEVDININTSFPWATDGDERAYDVQNCFTHELGHLLGLDDEVSKTSSTMYGSAELGESKKRSLAADDKNGIMEIYG